MIKKSDFNYPLPDERIAKHPLEQRSDSKLLVYKQGEINESRFYTIAEQLPENSRLIFNNARVIPARLFFNRMTGAKIELLLIEPRFPSSYEQNFNAIGQVQWKCIIGNLRKWKDHEILHFHHRSIGLQARLISREDALVELSWEEQKPFIQLLEEIGELPLPPYLHRSSEPRDHVDYQTIYARVNGSVAAPTAGLHFDDRVMASLAKAGIQQTELTLHVGAGTFLPVKDENVEEHPMHQEHFEISKKALEELLDDTFRVAVGTTSLRVLESLYWMGCAPEKYANQEPLKKLDAYSIQANESYEHRIERILNYLEQSGQKDFRASTAIMILPHYPIKSIQALITNFHLPESTLLLLVAAVVGEDWRRVYDYALAHEFRFLSYGDSSLLYLK